MEQGAAGVRRHRSRDIASWGAVDGAVCGEVWPGLFLQSEEKESDFSCSGSKHVTHAVCIVTMIRISKYVTLS